ncbi:hypothetical protein ACFE04_005462 [Oxalis oulophora]
MAAFHKKTKHKLYHKSKQLLISFFCLCLSLILLVISFRRKLSNPTWHDIIHDVFDDRRIKIGLVNVNDVNCNRKTCPDSLYDTVRVRFDRVRDNLTWKELFPVWIDENQKWGSPPSCPEIPLPLLDDYRDLDAIVARLPCDERWTEKEGIRDVYRLQVNLVVANLVAASDLINNSSEDRTVYVVFEGECEPMREVFRCDDMEKMVGDYRVYKPDLWRMKQKVNMPFGSCQIPSSIALTGDQSTSKTLRKYKREAYATMLHSSEGYVCGAIALAQSIKQQNSTKELLLFHDESISDITLQILKSAGWKLLYFSRIRSPFSEKGSYNEYNYSKLRLWQLKKYTKLLFIDADVLVLKNLDGFFSFPELSASANDGHMFNSGVMVVEPSMCGFEEMMLKTFELNSYNGGDQGFLNEIFTWWHRLPKKINYLKDFMNNDEGGDKHEIPDDVYAIHYLGTKPWMCYRDYDCNWDDVERHRFASDSAHSKWWEVYDKMPESLQKSCALTQKNDALIREWRSVARNASLPGGHWQIEPQDPRQYSLAQF